ncbi:hypothetical protein AB0M43_02710 [Longispora sp. NPDC051575]|uniref:hypothetical protein n=1 Tax=Longispora sp. NPDC051575 TaxID=3154943 RepID=UPI003423ACB3
MGDEIAEWTTPEPPTARAGGVFARRYGGFAGIARTVGAFVGLLLFAAYFAIDSSHLMSNHCFGPDGQIVCPIKGPDWARPIPDYVTLSGLLVALTGLAVGRPVRARALIAGFVLTAAALVGSWLIG